MKPVRDDTSRAKFFCFTLLVLGLVYFFYTVAHSAPMPKRPRAPRVRVARVTPYPTQGAGALALIAAKAVVMPPEVIGVYFFAVTAKDNIGLESDYSNEVSATNYGTRFIILAWFPSPGTNVITNYSIYWSGASRTYTNFWWAGTNLTAQVAWVTWLTNVVLTVTCTNSGTNIAMGLSPRGPWSKLNTTNFVATNYPSPRFFRGIGKNGNRVLITQKHV